MLAGNLDQRIVLQRAAMSTNALNEAVPVWNTFATVWAEVTFKSGREGLKGQQLNATLITRFVIRWWSAVATLNPKDRIIHDGKTYDISDVYGIGRHEGLEIHATARVD